MDTPNAAQTLSKKSLKRAKSRARKQAREAADADALGQPQTLAEQANRTPTIMEFKTLEQCVSDRQAAEQAAKQKALEAETAELRLTSGDQNNALNNRKVPSLRVSPK